jgi:hypothetical protein
VSAVRGKDHVLEYLCHSGSKKPVWTNADEVPYERIADFVQANRCASIALFSQLLPLRLCMRLACLSC